MKKKLIIDTDTASDDAIALIMALRDPSVEVEAITVVAGNVRLEQAVQNALYTISLCGSDMTVYPGVDSPLVRPLKTADHVHGVDGMSDIGLPLSGYAASGTNAIHKIIELANEQEGELILVCLAPLTNIACALKIDPSLANKVKHCVIMGGVGQGRGNVTPVSEYNFWADPEAAHIVFSSGMPITMVGWDISREYAVFDEAEVNRIKSIGTPLAQFAIDIQGTLIEYAKKSNLLSGFDLPDPIAMAVAIDEEVITESVEAHVSILLNEDDSRGQSVIDYTGSFERKPNANIVLAADSERFRQMLHKALA